MPLCKKRSFAFIHIPKTGGSSIEKLLGITNPENFSSSDGKTYTFDGVTYSPQHLTPKLLSNLVPEFSGLVKFCFTRHPYQKVVSEFFYLNCGFRKGVLSYRHDLLRDWIVNDLSKKDSDHKIDQSLYVDGCDYVFKYSDFGNAVGILNEIGIEVNGKMPHVLQSPTDANAVASSLPVDIYHLIEELYPNDFEGLGYERRYTPEPHKDLGGSIFFSDGIDAHGAGNIADAIVFWNKGAVLGCHDCKRYLTWISSR